MRFSLREHGWIIGLIIILVGVVIFYPKKRVVNERQNSSPSRDGNWEKLPSCSIVDARRVETALTDLSRREPKLFGHSGQVLVTKCDHWKNTLARDQQFAALQVRVSGLDGKFSDHLVVFFFIHQKEGQQIILSIDGEEVPTLMKFNGDLLVPFQ